MNDDVVHLRRGGTSLLLRLGGQALPCVLHWGPDLGEHASSSAAAVLTALELPPTDSVATRQEAVAVLPLHSAGWLARPGLLGSHSGRSWSPTFTNASHDVHDAGDAGWPGAPAGAVRVRSVATDDVAALQVITELELHPAGVIRLRAGVRNQSEDVFEVAHLEPALPVGDQAAELLDMTGRHVHERHPQRRPFDVGLWARESWGGRPGHDSPMVMCAGAAGFAFRQGRVWGVHVAWSGNQVTFAERSVTGWRLLRGGERILPGEIRLGQDEAYWSPWLVGSWGEGLDALSQRIHRYVRARPQHPARPRPVLLNTWEAVYFHHDVGRLLDLADRAAQVGVERFVLDDGWFRGRRDDHAGLGDWYVDEKVWRDGLHPLVRRVHDLGMEFGLWFEPEMVNLDSDLARRHPEWLVGTGHGPGVASRNQHVLNLNLRPVYAYLLDRISSIVEEYGVAYIKWDHNRPLIDAGDLPSGRPGVHGQTLALYRLMRELKERHSGLEIESCAGGGARIDLGILDVTDRVWVSDCIDAHERHRMVRWTGLLLPPELMGTHVGSGVDHTTGRTHGLSFRAGTAVWGHLGVEWDLTRATEEELSTLADWVRLHKDWRQLLHSGDVVHADLANPALLLEGVVASDASQAVYRLAALDHCLTWPPGRVQLPGLHPTRTYEVRALAAQVPDAAADSEPGWVRDGVCIDGRFLAEVGIQAPLLAPDHLVLIRVTAC